MLKNKTTQALSFISLAVLCLIVNDRSAHAAPPRALEAAQPRQGATTPDAFLKRLFATAERAPSERARSAIKEVLAHPEVYHFQLIVTEVEPSSWTLTPHEYRVDQEYLYPASAMKTFASLASLMYFTELSRQKDTRWVSPESPLDFHPKRCVKRDKSNLEGGVNTLKHELRQTQLVSSNRAFNHVFEVVGSERLHAYLSPLFPSLRVYHRLSSNETHEESLTIRPLSVCSPKIERETKKGTKKGGRSGARAVTLRPKRVTESDHNAPREASPNDPYTGYGQDLKHLKIGSAYIDFKTGERVESPMDFGLKNRVSLYDLQLLNMMISQPSREHKVFGVNAQLPQGVVHPQWLNLLREAMITYPRHSKSPLYKSPSLSETRFKPLIRGLRMSDQRAKRAQGALADENVYYLNKAGKALGFHLDNAFIGVGPGRLKLNASHQPTNLKRAAYLTVGLYVNEDGVLNDNKYEYDKISVPVLDALGYALGRYLQGELEPSPRARR